MTGRRAAARRVDRDGPRRVAAVGAGPGTIAPGDVGEPGRTAPGVEERGRTAGVTDLRRPPSAAAFGDGCEGLRWPPAGVVGVGGSGSRSSRSMAMAPLKWFFSSQMMRVRAPRLRSPAVQ